MNLARTALNATGLTQKAFAHALGVKPRALQWWLAGRLPSGPADTILKLIVEGKIDGALRRQLEEAAALFPRGAGGRPPKDEETP